jgi:hypothetical protein
MTTKKTEYDPRPTADIPLAYPVEVEAVKYASLTMRRPKTKDSKIVAASRGDDMAKGILLLANLCNVAPAVIEELDEIDTKALGDQLEAFRGGQLS